MKETIKISDYERDCDYNYWENLEIIYEECLEYDLDKCYVLKRLVLERPKDNKLFAISCRFYSDGDSDILKQIGEEVEGKTKTVTYYE